MNLKNITWAAYLTQGPAEDETLNSNHCVQRWKSGVESHMLW